MYYVVLRRAASASGTPSSCEPRPPDFVSTLLTHTCPAAGTGACTAPTSRCSGMSRRDGDRPDFALRAPLPDFPPTHHPRVSECDCPSDLAKMPLTSQGATHQRRINNLRSAPAIKSFKEWGLGMHSSGGCTSGQQ